MEWLSTYREVSVLLPQHLSSPRGRGHGRDGRHGAVPDAAGRVGAAAAAAAAAAGQPPAGARADAAAAPLPEAAARSAQLAGMQLPAEAAAVLVARRPGFLRGKGVSLSDKSFHPCIPMSKSPKKCFRLFCSRYSASILE